MALTFISDGRNNHYIYVNERDSGHILYQDIFHHHALISKKLKLTFMEKTKKLKKKHIDYIIEKLEVFKKSLET